MFQTLYTCKSNIVLVILGKV